MTPPAGDHGRVTAAGIRSARAERMARALAGEAVQSSGRLGDGYERPAVIPPDPADVAPDRYERDFVRAQRARSVSWFNIARMTGHTVPWLRAAYDDTLPEAPR